MSHAEALRPSRHLFTPPGTRPAKTAGLFWRSAGRDRADMGVQDGGWDYRWAAVDGGRTGWTRGTAERNGGVLL